MNRIAMVLGGLALAGAGAGATYLVLNKLQPPPVAAPAATAPAPVAPPAATPAPAAPAVATPAPPPAAASAPDSAAGPGGLQFTNVAQQYTFARDGLAYVGASLDAPQMYPLQKGTGFVSSSKSADGAWVTAQTADGSTAFLRTGDLGPYDPHSEPQLNLPATVSGTATVVDTATLSVDGKLLALAGIVGETGDDAAQMQAMIDEQGHTVKCQLQKDAYICMLASGYDLARTALFNGGADAAPDASADYKAQAAAAQAAHRGKWK